MNLLVCVKQVANLSAESAEEQVPAMNRFDEYAVEEALCIREALCSADPALSCRITAVTHGPDRAGDVVKRALGMGADHGIHIITPGGSSAFATAARLAALVKNQEDLPDIILTGIVSQDRMTGMVGPMLARLLGWPSVAGVVGTTISSDLRRAAVTREMEGGRLDRLQVTLPALFSVQAGINTPRYPSLSNMLKAAGKGVESISFTDLPAVEEREESLGLAQPEKTREGVFLEGSLEEKAGGFMDFMRDRGAV